MRVVYTHHALKKFMFLKELGWDIRPLIVDNIVKYPLSKQKGYSGTNIAVGSIDIAHDLRVIYSKAGDIITVVTFYPIKKGRYDKK